MTAYDGHCIIQSIRQLCAHQGPTCALTTDGESCTRTGARAGHESFKHPESAGVARAGRHRRGARGRADEALQDKSSSARSRRTDPISRTSGRARVRPAGSGRRIAQTPPAYRQTDLKLSAKSSLADVAISVGDALRRAGIRGVLTGGACAHLYTAGTYASVDVDFVLSEDTSASALDRALNPLGFQRSRDHWVHAKLPFYVEFPRGPLGIGEDSNIRPVWKRKRGSKTLALSATDACRDRLAAYYHWNDRQSLGVAVAIAMHNRIRLATVRQWSLGEGHGDGYRVFVAELKRSRLVAAGRAKRKPA